MEGIVNHLYRRHRQRRYAQDAGKCGQPDALDIGCQRHRPADVLIIPGFLRVGEDDAALARIVEVGPGEVFVPGARVRVGIAQDIPGFRRDVGEDIELVLDAGDNAALFRAIESEKNVLWSGFAEYLAYIRILPVRALVVEEPVAVGIDIRQRVRSADDRRIVLEGGRVFILPDVLGHRAEMIAPDVYT